MARKRYSNTDPKATPNTLKDLIGWQRERRAKVKDESYKIGQAENKQQKMLSSKHDHLTITWIGHSTSLLQIAGLTIITDPVWAKRMGVSPRLEEPGLTLDEIPPIDVVLLSHSHYDHLHKGSLKKLKGSPVVLVPVGLRRKVEKMMKGKVVHEFKWWDKMRIGSVEFHFVPAQHWTKRTFTDTNTSLWGGWVIKDIMESSPVDNQEGDTIYFAGDSGYFDGFRDIGERFPRITYTLMPIGAYEPEWFMGMQHVTPEEAVQAFVDVGAKIFIPMHYGAYRLADDTTKEALDRLLNEWDQRAIEKSRLRLLKHGETLLSNSEAIQYNK